LDKKSRKGRTVNGEKYERNGKAVG
jgi:hypothetical protein